MKFILTGILAMGLLAACTSSEQKREEQENPASSTPAGLTPPKATLHATIYVKKDGRIFLNQVLTDLKDLDEELKACRQKGCVIFYSRDDREQEPHNVAIQVMDLIAKQELPIQFYTDSTFTEIVEF
jgi:biopolymer transport protein ExbD